MPKKEKSKRDKESAEIICALATPEGTSALSVIRLSGKGSFEIVEKAMSLERYRLRGMRRKVGNVTENGRPIDEVVAISWPEGRSFTGEEMVEITCHGIPSSVREIIELLIRKGARRAEPGEFTRRAFVNGKMNAVQVIALAASWDTEKDTKQSAGDTVNQCRKMLREIERTRELVEGNIEFGDIHLEVDKEEIENAFSELVTKAEEFKGRTVSLEKKQRVMIMGPANSGKSTLFNVLTGKKAALVSDEPGTTRDGSTGFVEIEGRRIQLCDTAGTDGLGLDKTASESVINGLEGTDRVIWMSEGGRIPPDDRVRKKTREIIEIEAKSDINERKDKSELLRVSSLTEEGMEELRKLISEFPGSMSLSGVAKRIEEGIKEAMEYLSSNEYDMAAELLKEAEIEMRRLLGKGENIQLSVERALAGMCVGK
ncbi:MAG: 50S ribosome-binding GTPase [Candidatus Aegiribacteria sp.]|nr:50S ribosome-binding GTPase [Candidatus Aegiribacteria sp.]